MKYDCSDRELVEQITENPYLQYFIGLPHFQYDPPFDPSLMVAFRKRIDLDVSFFLNEEFLKKHNGKKESSLVETIRKVYEQQKYMYDNRTHSVDNRIVSLSQPYIRPIVRGKAESPVEFGVKLNLSIDEDVLGPQLGWL